MKNKKKILLIEDEKKLQDIIKFNLVMEKYQVDSIEKAPNILSILEHKKYDLIILDIMLPEKDGLTICETIRTKNKEIKILILSAKSSSVDRSNGIIKGADDYMVKPFELPELLFRVNKLTEPVGPHVEKKTIDIFEFGGNQINFALHQAITFDNQHINLTKIESALIKFLIANAGVVQTRDKILSKVWKFNIPIKNRTLDNCILKFRKYFEKNSNEPIHFISKRGLGYVFIDEIKKIKNILFVFFVLGQHHFFYHQCVLLFLSA